MTNEDINNYYDSFSKYLTEYDENLNIQGIWLFLATLGCWSVPEGLFRITAFSITILIFINRLFIAWKEEKEHVTFKVAFQKVEGKISELESEVDRNFWSDVLDRKKKHHLSFLRSLKTNYLYIISFTFCMICFAEAVFP